MVTTPGEFLRLRRVDPDNWGVGMRTAKRLDVQQIPELQAQVLNELARPVALS